MSNVGSAATDKRQRWRRVAADRWSVSAYLRRLSPGLVVLTAWFAICSSPALAASAPSVEDEYAEKVGITSADLGARINPNEAATTYRFEYGPTEAYGTSVPASAADVGVGAEGVLVAQAIGDLTPGTLYHYRVVATNAEGATVGSDQAFTTFAPESAAGDTCSNTIIRAEQFSAFLPDCRAYEMVSPPNKNGGDVAADPEHTIAAVDGNAIKYSSTTAFGDAQGAEVLGAEYISHRETGGSGWTTHGINPPQEAPAYGLFGPQAYVGFSPDLSKGVYFAKSPVISGHPNVEHVANLYLRTDLLTAFPGTYQLLSDSVAPVLARSLWEYNQGIEFDGASADWSHLIFETYENLTSNAPSQPAGCGEERELYCLPRLYEWHDGQVTLVGILPGGTVAEASVGGGGGGGGGYSTPFGGLRSVPQGEHAISSDGSRVIFTAGSLTTLPEGPYTRTAGDLYMRINGDETIQLNVSERTDCADHSPCTGGPEPDPAGHQPVAFMRATPDDSKVLFVTREELTDDAGPTMNLYMFSADAPAGKHLTLISHDEEPDAEPAGTTVLGASEDLSYIYFVSKKPLLRGEPPIESYAEELYVWHAGQIRTVAIKPDMGELVGWGEGFGQYKILHEFRVTPDGKTAVFETASPELAKAFGYDNQLTPKPGGSEARGEYVCDGHVESRRYCKEIYLYHYPESLTCVSCDPSGARPVSNASMESIADFFGGITFSPPSQTFDEPLTKDGRYVFFNTVDALVPRDTNGYTDVYEYDADTRRVALISSGTCACSSNFLDASASGSDAFFVTHQPLVKMDFDTGGDVYDARVGGGIAAQNEPAPAPCEGDDCQGPAKATPGASLPASLTFSGAGNIPPAGRGASPPARSRSTGAKQRARALKACRRRASRRARRRCEARVRARFRKGRAAAGSSLNRGRGR